LSLNPGSWDLLTCAKVLFDEAMASPQTLGPKAHLLRMMNEPVTLCFGGGYAILSFCILPSAFTLGIARPDSGG